MTRAGAGRRTEGGGLTYTGFMAQALEIGTLLNRDPAIRSNRPKIAGTGVTVMRIAGWYKQGLSPEEIVTQYGHLTLAQVHAALAYYHANTGEIEAGFAAEEALADGMAQ